MRVRHAKAQSSLEQAASLVWLVMWYSCNDERAGVHGIFESEDDARVAAERMQHSSPLTVYKISQWMVVPSDRGQR